MQPPWARIAAVSLLALGLTAALLHATAPMDDGGPQADASVSPVTASSSSLGLFGQRLDLPPKSPLILPQINAQGPAWYPVKEALVYAGCTVVWRSSACLLQISAPDGTKARLILGEPYLYESLSRIRLAGSFSLQGGAPALSEADLRMVLARLVSQPPTWRPASSGELGAVVMLYRGTVPSEPSLEPTQEPELEPSPVEEVSSQVAARVLSGGKLKTIVLDAGHGGHDPGAHGQGGLLEKDVCLDIILRTQKELKRLAPDLNIVLTRDKDEFISLRERTEIANKANADLFVSVHNNASPNRKSKGTQVFFYDQATSDRAATDLVSRENEDVNELDVLLTDIAKSLVRDQSIGFASRVQTDLGHTLGLEHRELSFAPFYVLARTKMPAILIEVAFITHKEEERLLGEAEWRQKVAASIARGIVAYRKQIESSKP